MSDEVCSQSTPPLLTDDEDGMDSRQASGSDSEPPKKKPMTAAERVKLYRQKKALLKKQSESTEVDECKRTQSSPPLMKKPMTPAERKRASRARQVTAETSDQTDHRQELDSQRVRQRRSAETGEQTEHRQGMERQRFAERVVDETADQTEQRQELDRQRHAARIAAETAVQTEHRQQLDRQMHAAGVAAETVDQTGTRQLRNRVVQAGVRARRLQARVEAKVATRTAEILSGDLFVPDLSDSPESIGQMTHVCGKCGAYKFRNETIRFCCMDGEVDLTPFPEPPRQLKELWHGDVPQSKLFLDHCRVINNAVCLSSLAVTERIIPGAYNPCVIFQGRICQRMGPLRPEDNPNPRFAQLYVLDPGMETTTRFGNMTLPDKLTETQKTTMKNLLEKVQQVIHEKNPFVHDFKQLIEISEEELQGGKVVISASARPQQGHARVYNVQENLQELSIVTNELPHDLVLNLRGGGFEYISDLNPKAMPLHFTLLFPEGTTGWDKELTHVTKRDRRITPREFFVYHLNIRQTCSDYIFKAQRLFQEWILSAWIVCENQRLNYMRQNQKTLRADTYQNLQEAVHERMRSDSLFNNEPENTVGRLILASSFQSSPRWYNAKFQDAMAIVR